jgi:hypothetical protein
VGYSTTALGKLKHQQQPDKLKPAAIKPAAGAG